MRLGSGPSGAARVGLAALALLILTVQQARPAPADRGTGSGLEPLALVPFQRAAHLALETIKGREYAFVSYLGTPGGVKVIDVTNPARPRVRADLACGSNQNHLQISHDKKTLIVGVDSPAVAAACMPPGEMGFATIDISDPSRPRPLGYAVNENGSHTTAAHPTKPYVYNGEGFPDAPGRMQVWSIDKPGSPKLVSTLDTGEHSAHDLSFSRDGTMAALAAVTSIKLLDTTDPADPKIEFVTQCPGCMHTHEARFTPDGKYLVVNDEWLASPNPCPGAAMYFYEITEGSAGERALVLRGVYVPGDLVVNRNQEAGMCTAHVFDISSDGTKVATAWHSGGVHYLDITGKSGFTFGDRASTPDAPKEIGWYVADGADTFSAKLHKGPYVYTADYNRGFEIYRVTSPGP